MILVYFFNAYQERSLSFHTTSQMLQLSHIFIRVRWRHPLILIRCLHEHRRIYLFFHVVEWRILGDEVVFEGDFSITKLTRLIRAQLVLVVIKHVSERHLADASGEEVWFLIRTNRHNEAAVGVANDDCLVWSRVLLDILNILSSSYEIIEAALLALFQGGCVPLLSELSTPADIGNHYHPIQVVQEHELRATEIRRQRYVVSPIGRQHRRYWLLRNRINIRQNRFLPNHKGGNARPILARIPDLIRLELR